MNCPLLKVMLTVALTCLPLPPLSAHGEKGDVPSKEVLSPLGDMYAEFREGAIWLVDKDRENKKLLYSSAGSASILFSPDQKYIAINDHCCSTDTFVVLYSRVSGLEYKEMKVEVSRNAWEFFSKQHPSEKSDGSDTCSHSYAKAVLWSADSSSILMSLEEYGGKRSVPQWCCIYDIKHNKMTLDLNVLNRGSIKLETGK